MTLKAHLYLSVRNPNSYFAARQYHQLQQSHDIDIEVRTVYPLAIRYPEYFEKNSEANKLKIIVQNYFKN